MANLRSVVKSATKSNFGPMVQKLESDASKFFGCKAEQVVSFSSATLAISAAIVATGKAARDDSSCFLPDFTFAGTLFGAVGGGIRNQIVDIDRETWMPRWEDIEEGFDFDKDIFLPVLPFGAGMQKLDGYPRSADLVVDAAGCLGAFEGELQQISKNWVFCFSLHATKVMGSGEGGLAVFGDGAEAKRARAWSNFGLEEGSRVMATGSNAKMSEYQAAIAVAAFQDWSQEKREWKSLQRRAEEITAQFDFLELRQNPKAANPYWIVQFCCEESKKVFALRCAESSINVRNWWPESMAEIMGGKALTNSDYARSTSLGLPMFRGLSESDFGVIKTLMQGVTLSINCSCGL